MLNQNIYIFNPTSIGGGQYTTEVYFENGAQPKYFAIGDYIEDTNNNRYEVTSGTFPFNDGGVVTVDFVDNDVIPQVDTGFDSLAYTPGQVNLRPELQTPGLIFNISIFDSSNYEYQLEGSWDISAQASAAVVGDRIADDSGFEYIITFLDAGQFADPFRVQEVEKIGNPPNSGIATLYRSKSQFGLFIGSPLTDPARTEIRNRDNIILENTNFGGGGANGEWTKFTRVISASDIIGKSFTISPTPLDVNEVVVKIASAPDQNQGLDYSITGSTFSWNGLGLDGVLEENDTVVLYYFS